MICTVQFHTHFVPPDSAQVFRNQDINIHEQLELGRYWGPLHKPSISPVPQEPGLEEVRGQSFEKEKALKPTMILPTSLVVYNDSSKRVDPTANRWHTDTTYELQPPSTTLLKMLTCPESGGDTLWSSGYALYSSLSPGLQTYLENLSAMHSATERAGRARAAGSHVRREPIETVHPVVRVHPATGWKSVYVDPSGCIFPFHLSLSLCQAER